MRIDFITDKVYPYFVGGQEKRIHEYSHFLAQEGHQVTIVSMKWWEGKDRIKKDGIEYISLCPKYQLYKQDGKRYILPNIIFGVKTFFYALRTDAQIIDCEIFPYFPVMFIRLVKIIARKKFKIYGYWAEFWGRAYWKQYYPNFWWVGVLLEQLCLSCCDMHLANSDFTRQRIISRHPQYAKNIQVTYPFSIDECMVEREEQPNDKRYDLIYFGRLIYHKHVEKLIILSKKLIDSGQPVRVLIIGDGPEKKRLQNMAAELGIINQITFIPFIEDYQQLIERIRSAKVMIFPSEREGFGISVLEAQACGVPVIVWDYPDNAAKDLIKDQGTGAVCIDDEQAFKAAQKLLNNELYRTWGMKAIDTSRAFSKKQLKQRLIQLYS